MLIALLLLFFRGNCMYTVEGILIPYVLTGGWISTQAM